MGRGNPAQFVECLMNLKIVFGAIGGVMLAVIRGQFAEQFSGRGLL
jgi:hypothetical protein